MRVSLRCWCLSTALPGVGDLLHLEELDAKGAPTGRRVRVRVEAAPPGLAREPRSTARMFAVDVPRELPGLCRCGHIRILHAIVASSTGAVSKMRGACALCGVEICEAYTLPDARTE